MYIKTNCNSLNEHQTKSLDQLLKGLFWEHISIMTFDQDTNTAGLKNFLYVPDWDLVSEETRLLVKLIV